MAGQNRNWRALIVGVLIPNLVGLVSGFLSMNGNGMQWYMSLNKPIFTPPGYIFPVVWTILYTLMGVASYLAWKKEDNVLPLGLYTFQLFINGLWSLAFFGLQLPLTALFIIILLLASVSIMILQFEKLDERTIYLLTPYLAWITVAFFLNLYIVILN